MTAAAFDGVSIEEQQEREAERRRARGRALRSAARTLRDRLRLPPRIAMAEWADRYRYVSAPAAQAGPWRTDRAPYLREIMDTISSPAYQEITIVKCSQSGGTEVLLNTLAYYVDQEPSSILVVQPNVEPMAKDFSKDRLAPMFRDTARLRGKIRDPRSRDSGNTILHKVFAGGHLTVVGANSPAGLATRPIRIVLADEVDRWGASAGSEGDPLSLAEARQTTFRHRRKRVVVTSPGNEGESRVEKIWPLTDRRFFYVRCPHCQREQPFEWRDTGGRPDIRPGLGAYRLIWEKTGEGDAIVHHPETAAYVCCECACTIEETFKAGMIAKGGWVRHNPDSRHAGFHIDGFISSWVRWSDLARWWLEKKDDEEQRKGYFNTRLGLLYVVSGEAFDPDKLSSRREAFPDDGDVPAWVGLLTLAIDVQGDRIECEVRGWGAHEESTIVRLERFYGDPQADDDVWERARALVDREWKHAAGATMTIAATMCDTGYAKDAVFRFVKSMPGRNVFCSKGADNAKQPLSRASKANSAGVKVFTIHPTSFKDVLFARLKKKVPGPGYLHFGNAERTGVDDAFFQQYAAEKRQVKFVNNQPVVRYLNPQKKRNEAIDLYVLNLAALRSRGAIVGERLSELAQDLQDEGAALRNAAASTAAGAPDDSTPTTEASAEPDTQLGLKQRRGRGGWMSGG